MVSRAAAQIESSPSPPRSGPSPLPSDAYPVLRVATEYYLRSFSLLNRLQDDVVRGMILLTLLHNQLPAGGRGPVSGRALSRTLGVPHETVRRHAAELVRGGQCLEKAGRLVLSPAVRRSRGVESFLRGLYGETARFLADLTRLGVAAYRARSPRPRAGRLAKEQLAVALAATAFLVACLKTMRAYWAGDVVKGLVFTAIWTANVKHLANTAAVDVRDVLDDRHRQPVSVLEISKMLGLPYETARRHAQALMSDGLAVRVGNRGLIAPETAHRKQVTGVMSELSPRDRLPRRPAAGRREGLTRTIRGRRTASWSPSPS